MYPNLNAGLTAKPSAPPASPSPPPSSSTSASLANTAPRNPVGFSSLMAQSSNQNTPYPPNQTSQSMYPGAASSSQPPYPSGQGNQPPYPAGPGGSQPPYPPGPGNQPGFPPTSAPYSSPYGSSSSQPGAPRPPSSSAPYSNPYGSSSSQPGAPQPPSSSAPYSNPYGSSSSSSSSAAAPGSNPGGYSPYNLPGNTQTRPAAPPPAQGGNYGNNPYGQSQNPYANPNTSAPAGGGYGNPYAQPNPYQPQSGYNPNPNPYQQNNPYGQQPPPPQGPSGHQNPHQQSNPYPPQSGGYPPHQPPPRQSAPYSSPYGAAAPPPPSNQGGYGGYPPYQSAPPYQNSYGQPPAGGSGYNSNAYGGPALTERLRSVAGRYEINDTLAQRLSQLQQFEIVVLCDDSGSMNTPVDGTQGTRWDELRSIVQIIIEIGIVFDSNGVDVHFLNRPPMMNVTDARQVVESFSQRPGGLTPLTAALRRIFQSQASKPGSDKRLLVFVATDGAPTDDRGNVDIPSLENLMRHERQANTTYVTFLACTDDDQSVAYLSQWDRAMQNVDVVDDYKSEREEIRRTRGYNYPFTFGDYVAKALLGAIDPQLDQLDEGAMNNNNNNDNYRRF